MSGHIQKFQQLLAAILKEAPDFPPFQLEKLIAWAKGHPRATATEFSHAFERLRTGNDNLVIHATPGFETQVATW
jgi:hypothetical protein